MQRFFHCGVRMPVGFLIEGSEELRKDIRALIGGYIDKVRGFSGINPLILVGSLPSLAPSQAS